MTTGIFSIDVKGKDCDLISDDWVNDEKLIQGETYIGETLQSLAPGQEITKSFDHTFYNACYTDRLRVIVVASQTMQYDKSDFKPYANPDAFLNCWLEMSTFVAFPILKYAGILDGDMKILLNGVKLGGLDAYKVDQSLREGDFKAVGDALFKYCEDLAKILLQVAGKQLIATVISGFRAGINEWNHRGCGETLPHVYSEIKDIITGMATASYEAGYKMLAQLLGSPADLEVIDAFGSTVYVGKFGEEVNHIPDSVGFIINDGSEDPIKAVLTVSDGPFTANLYGTSTGVADFSILQPRADENLVRIDYTEIPITPRTFATTPISDEAVDYHLFIDSDGDGSLDTIKDPDSLQFLAHETSTCSTLGAGKSKSLDLDAFDFSGEEGEQITIILEAHTGETSSGQNAALTLIGPQMFRREVSAGLPNELLATLPMSGEYYILVGNMAIPRKQRFTGNYCLTLQSS
jgi:hypothetical protein